MNQHNVLFTKDGRVMITLGVCDRMEPISIYIHIPFCQHKCPYCDFNTYAGMNQLIPDYVEALRQEIALWKTGDDSSAGTAPLAVKTIFFGGGTPSLLAREQVEAVLEACRRSFSVLDGAEVSLEANPETVTLDSLRGLLGVGVNRLSIGAQSFDQGELNWLGRGHAPDTISTAYQRAREAGFDSINLDLIYGLSEQRLPSWEKSLRHAVDLGPDHLSLYALTIEEGTPFGREAAAGRLPLPDPDAAADMYLMADTALSDAGYSQYEISNWAKQGHSCAHNITYWENRPYLGFGAGAHSYYRDFRYSNLRLPRNYISVANDLAEGRAIDGLAERHRDALRNQPQAQAAAAILARSPVDDLSYIDEASQMADTMILGLRLMKGVSNEAFKARFGSWPREIYSEAIKDGEELGLLEEEDGCLKLTSRGRLLANDLFVRFLL